MAYSDRSSPSNADEILRKLISPPTLHEVDEDAFLQRVGQLHKERLEVVSAWKNGEGLDRTPYDGLMQARFLTRIRHNNMLTGDRDRRQEWCRLIQRIKIDIAEDWRLTRMALECDSEGLDRTIKTKAAKDAIQTAEHVLEQAKRAARVAEDQESQHIARFAKEARIVSYAERTCDLSPELMAMVLRAAVVSERLRWRATDSLEKAIDVFWAWPSSIDPSKRHLLQRETKAIMLDTTVIEIPTHFTKQNREQQDSEWVPVIPKALDQSGEHVRHLVLDLRLDNRDNAFQRELNNTCSSMDALRVLCPRLDVCVVSFFFKNKDSRSMSFAASKLSLQNRTNYTQSETLETSLINLINMFHERGPGDCKLVRFIDQAGENPSHAGRLTNITSIATRIAEEALLGEDASGENSVPDIGGKVLTQAYCYYRRAAYRREMP